MVKELELGATRSGPTSQPAGPSSTTNIANMIRRSGRQLDAASDHRQQIAQMIRDGSSPRQLYQAGTQEGELIIANNLADVLYAAQFAGLGRIAVIEESNSHIVFRLGDCVGCRSGNEIGCHFVSGFLAGALLALGRFQDVVVSETSCGEYPVRTCVYRADLRVKA
jgi:predicted hydrocarbon binding protein